MLLFMRRVGEAIRINKNILVEIQQANENEVIFGIHEEFDDKNKNPPPNVQPTGDSGEDSG